MRKMGNETVLVTGATGFVGSRLVERLVLGTDYRVKAMVRRFSGPGLARLARLPVEFVLADLMDLESLTRVAKSCDIIVHCAYGSSGNKTQRQETTVSGAENVLKAALQRDVRKVIHLSSSAVHGRDLKGPVVDESAPFTSDRDLYSASKIEAEKVLWRYQREHALPVVVFRPTLIYGPYGRMWTERIVKEVQAGAILVNGGSGAANLVYIDNLIDAILLAIEKDSGDGEAFILVDDERLTWQDVYASYADMMSFHPPLQSMSVDEIEAMRKVGQPSVFNQWFVFPWHIGLEVAQYTLRPPEMRRKIKQIPWIRFISKLVPWQIKNQLKGESKSRGTAPANTPPPCHIQLPGQDIVELYTSRSRFSNEKVKRILGYTQRIPFDEAIDLTRSWLQYQRLIP
jgi:nucleoside-diphosphate-sugar epimerase